MSLTSESWSTQQLVEFVALISAATDRGDAAQRATERAAEALEAEVCAVVSGGSVMASIGFRHGAVPDSELQEAAEHRRDRLPLPGIGEVWTISAELEGEETATLIAGRAGSSGFSQEEADLLRGMARVLALTLRLLETVDHEREMRRRSQREARQRRKAERELAHRTLHDSLTGLPNRSLLRDRAAHAIERSRSSGALIAALFVDVDNFKLVNDSLGQSEGDQLLIALSRRFEAFAGIQASRHRGCTVARVGGDEFVLLYEELEDEHEAIVIAERLLEAISSPAATESRQLAVSASIGIALASPHTTAEVGARVAADRLLRDADVAMSRAKESGRNRYEVFDEQMRIRMLDRLQLEADLRGALERDELRLVYQPVVSVQDASTVSYEALVRWQHPQRGLLLPGSFIGVAEESELIAALGEWVLREGCRQLAAWLRDDHLAPGVRLSVNVSARELRPSFVGFVRGVLEESGVPPERLALEITERLLIEQADSSGKVLDQLRELGVGLVLDDFGTGYSSLSYLKSFPLDQIKLDRAFIGSLVEDPRSAKIVSATIEMARALGMTVVAEGVENSEQLQVLQRLRCDFAQGFHIARPAPAEALPVRFGPAARVERSAREAVRSEEETARLSPPGQGSPERTEETATRRRIAVGRVSGLFFLAGALLTTPTCLILDGSIDPLVALGLSLMALVSGAVCLALPWRRLRDGVLHVFALMAIFEVVLTIGLVGHAGVFSWYYVLIAAAAAYAFPSRWMLTGYSLLLVSAMFLPGLWPGAGISGDAPAMMLVGSAVLGCAVGATAILRERLEAGQAELRELVVRDALTGVGNYRLLHDRLEYELRRHQRSQRPFALLLIDLDRFKQVNEQHGHAAGDEALRRVARALSASVRQQDTLARQGGDEFTVLAPETNLGEAERLAARIRERVGAVRFAGETLGATIGIAVYPGDGGSAQVLLARADGRLIADKNRRRQAEPAPERGGAGAHAGAATPDPEPAVVAARALPAHPAVAARTEPLSGVATG